MTMGQRKSFGFFLLMTRPWQFLYTADAFKVSWMSVPMLNAQHLPPRDFAPLHPIHPMIARTKTLNREIVRAQWVIEACNMLMQMA